MTTRQRMYSMGLFVWRLVRYHAR